MAWTILALAKFTQNDIVDFSYNMLNSRLLCFNLNIHDINLLLFYQIRSYFVLAKTFVKVYRDRFWQIYISKIIENLNLSLFYSFLTDLIHRTHQNRV